MSVSSELLELRRVSGPSVSVRHDSVMKDGVLMNMMMMMMTGKQITGVREVTKLRSQRVSNYMLAIRTLEAAKVTHSLTHSLTH